MEHGTDNRPANYLEVEDRADHALSVLDFCSIVAGSDLLDGMSEDVRLGFELCVQEATDELRECVARLVGMVRAAHDDKCLSQSTNTTCEQNV